jgi:hypothetical protein
VIGAAQDVKLTIGGSRVTLSDGQVIENASNVKIAVPRANVQAGRAKVSMRGMTLQIVALPL